MQDKNIKILVADDSLLIRTAMKKILQDEYTLVMAENGEQAIELFWQSRPDIMILDINMPYMSGLEVIDYVRGRANDQDVYILVLTSEEAPHYRTRALNAGANDFLLKPFSWDELRARVGVAKRQVRLNYQLTKSYQRISSEVDMIASLQSSLLPSDKLNIKDIRIQSLYYPSGRASGDYYDYFELQPGVVRAIVADVSGHGVRAAFIMSIVRTLFQVSRVNCLSLEQTLSLINDHLCDIVGEESDFVTAFVLDWDFNKNMLSYINAGHCPGMLRLDMNNIFKIEPNFSVLGFFPLVFEAINVDLTQDSGILLFTDGFYEWKDSQGNIFDLDNFWEIASSLVKKSPFYLEELKHYLDSIDNFTPAYSDDLTALWLEKYIYE